MKTLTTKNYNHSIALFDRNKDLSWLNEQLSKESLIKIECDHLEYGTYGMDFYLQKVQKSKICVIKSEQTDNGFYVTYTECKDLYDFLSGDNDDYNETETFKYRLTLEKEECTPEGDI